jgi:hypothetical protein
LIDFCGDLKEHYKLCVIFKKKILEDVAYSSSIVSAVMSEETLICWNVV